MKAGWTISYKPQKNGSWFNCYWTDDAEEASDRYHWFNRMFPDYVFVMMTK